MDASWLYLSTFILVYLVVSYRWVFLWNIFIVQLLNLNASPTHASLLWHDTYFHVRSNRFMYGKKLTINFIPLSCLSPITSFSYFFSPSSFLYCGHSYSIMFQIRLFFFFFFCQSIREYIFKVLKFNFLNLNFFFRLWFCILPELTFFSWWEG